MIAVTGIDQTTRLKNLPQRTYPLRVLGMGLAGFLGVDTNNVLIKWMIDLLS